tara:strand:+ start:8362 stop:8664 length:303 start_codon:yes stop_codon:yes gene_type:complete
MIFVFIYLLINIVLAFITSLFFKNKFLKMMSLFFVFTLLSAFWFKAPGNPDLAPILSILFLESTIIQESGYMRLIRPLSALLLFSILISFLVWFFRIKRK